MKLLRIGTKVRFRGRRDSVSISGYFKLFQGEDGFILQQNWQQPKFTLIEAQADELDDFLDFDLFKNFDRSLYNLAYPTNVSC